MNKAYERETEMWNQIFKECTPVDLRNLDLKVEPMFDEALKIFAERTTNILDFGCGTGYFDSDLTILSVSGMLLHSTGHTRDSLMEQTKGSLRNFFYGENVRFLEENRFPSIEGRGEGQILTSDGTPINVYLYKKNTTDKNGQKIWVMSVQMNWQH